MLAGNMIWDRTVDHSGWETWAYSAVKWPARPLLGRPFRPRSWLTLLGQISKLTSHSTGTRRCPVLPKGPGFFFVTQVQISTSRVGIAHDAQRMGELIGWRSAQHLATKPKAGELSLP